MGRLKFTALMALMVMLLVMAPAVNMQGVPCVIRGIVTYDGAGVSGAQVSDSTESVTSGGGGSYSVEATSGSSVTVTATYNGHSASITVGTPSGGGFVDGQNIAISSGGGSGGSGGSSGSGGGYSTPVPTPVPTPTPTPTPTPPNRLYVPMPASTTIGTVAIGIAGTQVTVPMGNLFTDVVKNGTLEVPIAVGDNATGRLLITVDEAGSQSGTIRTMDLLANKILTVGGQQIGVALDISLSNLPAGSSLNFDLKSTDSVDMTAVNAQLAAYTDKKFSATPLLVFEATKNGIQNGRDITGAKFTFTVPRPVGFSPNDTYYVVRQSDGMMEVLNATLIDSRDADLLTFEVVSPHGLSTFSLVKKELAQPSTAQVTSTPQSTPMPTDDGIRGSLYMMIIGLVVGVIGGAGAMFLVLRVGGR